MGKGNVLKLCVNFQPEVIALSKEVGICVLFGQVLCKTSSYMEVYFIETSHNVVGEESTMARIPSSPCHRQQSSPG